MNQSSSHAEQPPQSQAERMAAIEATEALWPTLRADSPQIRALLENKLSRQMQRFIAEHRNFAEIFVTDPEGRLIAATQKTSDIIPLALRLFQSLEACSCLSAKAIAEVVQRPAF